MIKRPPPLTSLPHRHYKAVFADPPWQFKSYTALPKNWREAGRRDAEIHYPVMSLDKIKALPVSTIAARDSHLFLCATGPCLRQAFDVIDEWDYEYSGIAFTWVKLRGGFNARELRVLPPDPADMRDYLSILAKDFHFGLGLTTRHNAELVLLGRRGNARRKSRNVRELILAPAREHSRKPDEIRERIEQYCVGPYLELFAQSRRPGWDAWGNQTNRFA